MNNTLKSFIVIENNESEGILNAGVIDNIDIKSEISRQDFMDRLITLCKAHFDAEDVQLLETPDKYTAPPHITKKIEDMLQNDFWNFDLHIRVNGEEGWGSTLTVQETWFY
jgi:hypothetical protein